MVVLEKTQIREKAVIREVPIVILPKIHLQGGNDFLLDLTNSAGKKLSCFVG